MGGAGFDTLEGGDSAGVLYGEGDADVFRCQIGGAGEWPTLGGDTINGFKSGQDRIELTDLIMAFGIDPDNAFGGRYVTLLKSGADTQLIFDRDGIGATTPVVLATITSATVTQADVMLEGFA